MANEPASFLVANGGKSLGATIRAAAKLGAASNKPVKAGSIVPKMKQVAKLAATLGQTVTGITVNADGGFTVMTAAPYDPKQPAAKNPWDEVLE